MQEATGAALVVRLLEREGIELLTGIPGGANLPLYDALASSSRIRHILARHEQGAAFIAQGMARATGRPAVCLATSGPGMTNLVTALADAKLDSVPLVCLTGQVPTGMIGTDAFQEVDALGIAGPVTKAAWRVDRAVDLPTVIPEAFRVATSGRPGPVLVDLPKDVQLERIPVPAWPDPSRREPVLPPDPTAIARAAARIAAARRPVLYVGGGAVHAGAAELVRDLAERAEIPVAMTLMGLGVVPADHPLALGMLGMHGAACTNRVLAEADLLIAAGVRFDDRATGRLAEFCPSAEVVHIDIDARELGKLRTPTVGIRADLRDGLEALLPRIVPTRRPAWFRRVEALRRRHPLRTPGIDDPRTPYGLIRAVATVADPESTVTTDVGQHQMWVAQSFPFRRPRALLTSGGLGTMGFGLPAAIGAALADPGRPVICFTGDGSLLMNLQELAVAAETGVDVKVVLMDNASLGMVHQQQDLFFGGRRFASEFAGEVDFVRAAEAFGVPAIDLGRASDPEAALRGAISSPGPFLVRAPVARDEKVFPIVPPGAGNGTMLESDPAGAAAGAIPGSESAGMGAEEGAKTGSEVVRGGRRRPRREPPPAIPTPP